MSGIPGTEHLEDLAFQENLFGVQDGVVVQRLHFAGYGLRQVN